jgi:NAD(P)H-nitrite reductase large subunit
LGSKNKIAIIGSGGAAAECVKALRRNVGRGEIHLFTDSRWPVYNPMLTTYYVAGKVSFDQLFPYDKHAAFYREYGVDVHPCSPVVALDAEKRIVVNQTGFELNYEQCMIASGASPILPSVEGIGSKSVFVMRTVEDAIRLKEALQKGPRKAIVVGASMVGIKLTELFYNAGMEVCLVDLADRIFPLTAHPDCSRYIQRRLSQKGINFRFGASVKKIEDFSRGVRAYFDSCGDSEKADLLVMCIGVRPNMGFVDRKQVEINQGILVDEHMQTNLPGLYSAGDVSQGKNLLTGNRQIAGLWDNALYQGMTAGKNMAGINEPFYGTIPHNIAHFLGMDFVGIGDVCDYDSMDQKSDDNIFIQLFWKGELLTGANLVNNYAEAGVIKNALLKGLRQNKIHLSDTLPGIQNWLFKKTLLEVK